MPVGDRALAWIRKYIDEERHLAPLEPDDLWLFLTEEGEALSAVWLTKAVRRHIEHAEIGKSENCHLFRHTMATLMLEGGADIRFIQDHAS